MRRAMDRSRPATAARRTASRCALAALVAGAASAASAQSPDPAFLFQAPGDAKGPRWSGKTQAGVNVTSGNARGIALSGSALLARRAGSDRLSGEASGSLMRSRVDVATESDGVPGIGRGELREVVQTTTAAWAAHLRYDRFFGDHHSVYASGRAEGNEPAGKRLLSGLQLGYSRALPATAQESLWLEAGYDLAHQDFVRSSPTVTIHSARFLAAYQLKLATGATALGALELLTNLNGEDRASGRVAPLRDDRASARLELGVNVSTHGQLAVRLRARYDSSPAPRPPPPGASFEPGFVPLADRLDTASELLFVYAFP
jgi:hypothetical protein